MRSYSIAVRRGLLSAFIGRALLFGAVLGFTTYATYDLTNQANLRNWSTMLTIADLILGMVLSATAAGAGFWVTQRLAKTSDGSK